MSEGQGGEGVKVKGRRGSGRGSREEGERGSEWGSREERRGDCVTWGGEGMDEEDGEEEERERARGGIKRGISHFLLFLSSDTGCGSLNSLGPKATSHKEGVGCVAVYWNAKEMNQN